MFSKTFIIRVSSECTGELTKWSHSLDHAGTFSTRSKDPAMATAPREGKRPRRTQNRAESLNVVVAGGGIAGLAVALALQKRGCANVTVYERDESFDQRPQGYGMTLTTTNTALADLGILDELRRRDTQSHSHYVFRQDGAILGYFGRAFACDDGKAGAAVTAERGNLRVPREVLRRMLLERLTPGTVRWGERVVRYTDDPAMPDVTVDVSAGAKGQDCTVHCDVLVGAEGIGSVIRRQKTGDELKYLGVMAVVGITPVQHPLLAARGFYTVDGEHRLFTMPFADAEGDTPATTMWQLTFRCDEDEATRLAALPRPELLDEIKRRVAGWHAPVAEMVAATDPGGVWADPLYDRDPMQPPRKGTRSRVTVVGDSCHPMSPFKGQGANTALWSAVRLATCLDTLPLSSATAVYEREMLARAAGRVHASREAVDELHSAGAIDVTRGPFDFNGIERDAVPLLLVFLEANGVTAESPDIDGRVVDAIKQWREQR